MGQRALTLGGHFPIAVAGAKGLYEAIKGNGLVLEEFSPLMNILP